MKIDFYYVDDSYIEYLKKYEIEHRGYTAVPNVQYHSGNTKFFYGTVFTVKGVNYFVPISSKTHNKQDDLLIVIKDKKHRISGTLRFAYMIPVPSKCLNTLIRDSLNDRNQSERVRKELAFCRRNRDKISKRAAKTYERVTNKVSEELVRNSCDFKLLEKAFYEYCLLNGFEAEKNDFSLSGVNEMNLSDLFEDDLER